MEEHSDEALMAATAEGSESAFEELVRRHQNLVYGTAAKMLGGAGPDAEDIAQQVFIRVYRAAPRYQPKARFTTWMLTILRNCVFTHCSRRKRHQADSLDQTHADGEAPALQIPDPEAVNSSDALLHTEMAHILEMALQELPEKQRMALVLRQYEHMEYQEIATVLGTSVSSVKSLLFRARDQLRAVVEKYLHEKGATFPSNRG